MPDILAKSTLVRREEFDPSNDEHVESLRVFLRTGNWGDVQFYSQLPYIEVPMTVLTAYACHMLQVERESDAEKRARLDAKNLSRPKTMTTNERAAARAAALAESNKLMSALLGTARAG